MTRRTIFISQRVVSALIVLAAFSALPVIAAISTGQVNRIDDGDTIAVVTNAGQQEVIRLAGIDAPESGQPFGAQSTENLAKLVSGKAVTLDCTGEVSYGRLVCKVLLPNGDDVDLDQVKVGLAWHYKQYQSEQSPQDRAAYAAAEDAARKARVGLWSDSNPVQPQDYRHHTASSLCFDDAQADHRVACGEKYTGPVRGNRHSGIYHWPGCPNYDDIAPQNRVEFPSQSAAQAAGYRAARNCP